MRVLFTPYPSLAHLWPIVPLAWALQNAGHEVRVASQARFADAIVKTGLTPVRLGDPDANEPRMRDDARQPAAPEEVLRYADALGLTAAERELWIIFFQYLLNPTSDYVRTDLPEAGDLVAFAEGWQPDLVVWDATFASGAVAAKVCGAAHVRLLLGPDIFGFSVDKLAERVEELRTAGLPENPLADVLRPLAERHGVEVDNELLVGQWSVDQMPTGLNPPLAAKTIPMRFMPFTGAAAVPEWLYEHPERPRIALTLGESTRRFVPGDARLPKILAALSTLDVEVVATLNELQLQGIDEIPANVRVLDWVNLTQLLPTCAAIIHHGGMGTTAAAIAFRVPQLILDTDESVLMRQVRNAPEAGSFQVGKEFGVREETEAETTQWVLPEKKVEATRNANYLIARGAGARLNHQSQTADEIAKVILQVVTDPAYREGVDAVHAVWDAMPNPAELVPVLERIAARR
jgi:UDP:flavonoid glycosyltransferase YjiC (YdhE family)